MEEHTFRLLPFRGNDCGLIPKAGSGPDSAEATENTEWVRTEFTENYDFPIPGFSSVTG